MKIKSLLLLGLLTMFGMNASAVEYFKANGIVYVTSGDVNRTATVYGLRDASVSTYEIPATVTGKITAGEFEFKVIGFDASWLTARTTAGSGFETEACTTTLKTLTVNIDNFTSVPTTADLSTALEKLTLKGTYDANLTVPVYTTGKTIDLSNLAVTSGKTLSLASYASNTNVEEITVPATMTGVDFKGSTKLVKISGIKNVAASAFQNVTTLTTVSLAEGATIGNLAFAGCKALGTINMSVATSIGNNAFDGAKNSIAIDLTAAKTIGTQAFKGNAAATLTIPAQVETIANYAFDGMGSLKTVNINVNNDKTAGKTIGTWFTQTGTGTITTVNINAAQVTKIDANAFQYEPITALTFTSAPALAEIGANAFAAYAATTIDLSACAKLKTVNAKSFPANAYTSVKLKGTAIDQANFEKIVDTSIGWLVNAKNDLAEITLPDAITDIPNGAFKDFKVLASIGLPKGLKNILANAFKGCVKLAKITFKGYLQTIGDNAFDGCTALATADFTQATELTTIGDDAFKGTKLTAIDLSTCAKLATVSASSFPQNAYTSVKLSGTLLDDTDFALIADPATTGAWLYGTKTTGELLCASSLTEITMPSAITAIPDYAFQGFKALTSVSLPKGVTAIGDYAFEASGLTAFKVRENVATIGQSAFENCTALAIVNFSEATALTYIDDDAFQNTAIKEVAIPANADATMTLTINPHAFANCGKLKSFSAKSWTGALEVGLFQNDAKLTGIVIPATITSIGADAFDGCAALATVTFKYTDKDAGLTGGIGARAFQDCASLATLDLSATKLTSLTAVRIFKGCTSLATLTFPETMTTLAIPNAFADCPIENLDASMVTTCNRVLFGRYWDDTSSSYVLRDADHANTTLKTVKIGGVLPTNCFAYCTALESVEYFDNGSATAADDVDVAAFEHCTALKSFTYEADAATTVQTVNDNAFNGCIPFVKFATNELYINIVAGAHGGKILPPLNTTFGDEINLSVTTVQDKANPNQFIAKFVHYGANDVILDASEAKLYSIYSDGGETAYFQALRIFDGQYHVKAGDHVIVKTEEAKEVTFTAASSSALPRSIAFDNLYDSKDGDDLADVQAGAFAANDALAGLPTAGFYLYRLTNTADQGFGFTFFNSTTIKAGQFFIVSSVKPEGAGRLEIVWLDEDGNVENTTAIQGVKKSLDINDGAIYNLQGVRVQKAQKGLYIQNGKKIFVK